MKANELRIGNWVYGINRRSEIHLPETLPLKILQIELFNCEVLPYDKNPSTEERWFKISNIDISPIPLTEEWLLKFGFEKAEDYDKNHGLYAPGSLPIYLTKEKEVWGENAYNINIQFVHQLQNLYFALTNTELTIK